MPPNRGNNGEKSFPAKTRECNAKVPKTVGYDINEVGGMCAKIGGYTILCWMDVSKNESANDVIHIIFIPIKLAELRDMIDKNTFFD